MKLLIAKTPIDVTVTHLRRSHMRTALPAAAYRKEPVWLRVI